MLNLSLSPTNPLVIDLVGETGSLNLHSDPEVLAIELANIVRGPQGIPGPAFANLDGGHANSTYGGITPIDGGSA